MELKQIRYFVAVAEQLHFGRAAEQMHIVASALSMQITALEKELGVQLLLRTSRSVTLTQAGRLFRAEAETTLQQVERAAQVARRASRGLAGRVRIGFVGTAFFAGNLTRHLRLFRELHEAVEIDIREMTAQAQIEALLDEKLDVGYCPAFTPRFHPGLRVHPVGDWRWRIAMSDRHRLAKKAEIEPEDLQDDAFLLYSTTESDRGQLNMLTRLLGYEPVIMQRASSTLAVFALVSAGIGVAMVPASHVQADLEGLAFKPLKNDSIRSRIVQLTSARNLSAVVAAYVQASMADVGRAAS